ncbi:hypothetical protein GCM10022240_16780 [Microbacterium kribbense]|uniref:DUF1214 domain-containing protein n=1 Tax=Microbacterium kribbense TaxID=433645 RepID=A0ABP7GMZ0_9MICO
MTGVFGWISQSGVVQGVIIGATFAFLTTILILNAAGRSLTRRVNGWRAIVRVGKPGNGVLARAACAKALPVVNSWEEAAYYTAVTDGSGRALRGDADYRLHFAAGQLPPTGAFWSLTPTDSTGYSQPNAAHRYAVGSRSDLEANPDGSVDVHLLRQVPAAAQRNWVLVPPGRFTLWLRVYLPGAAIVDGSYQVPPVVRETRA